MYVPQKFSVSEFVRKVKSKSMLKLNFTVIDGESKSKDFFRIEQRNYNVNNSTLL